MFTELVCAFKVCKVMVVPLMSLKIAKVILRPVTLQQETEH